MTTRRLKVLLLGSSGFVGSNLCELLSPVYDLSSASRKEPSVAAAKKQWFSVDILDQLRQRELLSSVKPDVVIHAAGVKDVKFCEANPEHARALNATATQSLAKLCEAQGVHLIYLSTDLVFPGTEGNYKESDEPDSPLVYGRTKAEGEVLAARETDRLAICRTAGIYGRRSPLLAWLRNELASGRTVECFTNVYNNPTLVDDLARALRKIIDEKRTGTFHVVGEQPASRYDFFRSFAGVHGLDEARLLPCELSDEQRKVALLLRNSSLNFAESKRLLGMGFGGYEAGLAGLSRTIN